METAAPQTQLGFAHFIAQADGLAHFLLVVLLAMSVVTWTLIVSKSLANWRMKKHAQAFLARFWDAPGLAAVADYLQSNGVNDPFSHLTHHGLKAAEQYRNKTGQRLIESGSEDEFLTRALRRAINQDTARLEYGHTMLASIASVRALRRPVRHGVGHLPRAGQHRHVGLRQPRPGRRSRGRGADHDRAGSGGRDPGGAGLQLLQPRHGARCSPKSTALRMTCSPSCRPACATTPASTATKHASTLRPRPGAHDGLRRTHERRGDGDNAEINMIPLIDVMLVLLVIFIITAPLMTHAVKVDLPRGRRSQPNEVKPETINLSIKADGTVYWNAEAGRCSRLAGAHGRCRAADAAAGNPHPRRWRPRLPKRRADHGRRRARRADQTRLRHRSEGRKLTGYSQPR